MTPLTLEDWKRAKGMQGAINREAEEAFEKFATIHLEQEAIERLFQRITERGEGDKPVRRPERLSVLVLIALARMQGASTADISAGRLHEIVGAFEERGLLVTRALADGDLEVDLPHECVAWKWDRLKFWITSEAMAAKTLRFFSDCAVARQPLTGSVLEEATRFLHGGEPTWQWARRYLSTAELDQVLAWISRCQDQEEYTRRRLERERRRAQITAIGSIVVALVVTALGIWAVYSRKQAEAERGKAQVALARSAIQDGIDLLQNSTNPEPGQAMGYFARALRSAPDSVAAVSWLTDRLLREKWWVPVMSIPEQQVTFAAFSPDGRKIVTASRDDTAQVWDSETGKPVTSTLRHIATVSFASFSPDGRRVVTVSWDHTAQVWDAATGKPVGPALEHPDSVSWAAFSPDGRRVATAYDAAYGRWEVLIWEPGTNKQLGPPLKFDQFVHTAQFSPDGQFLLIAADNGAQVWQISTGKPVGPLYVHENTVRWAAFSPDGKRIVTASDDHTAQVWDLATRSRVGERLHHADTVWSAQFSRDGQYVITASGDRTARVWFADTGRPASPPLELQQSVELAELNTDGRHMLTVSNGVASIWEIGRVKADSTRFAHLWPVHRARLTPDSKSLETVSWNPDLLEPDGHKGAWATQMWNTENSKPVSAPVRHTGQIDLAVFSNDGRLIATTLRSEYSAFEDTAIRVWDVETGLAVGPPLGEYHPVVTAAFSPDGRRLVSASVEGVGIWDYETGKLPDRPSLHADVFGLNSAAFSLDTRRVMTTGWDGSARIWDTASGKQLGNPLPHQSSAVDGLAFSADDQRVVTATGSRAQVWDLATGRPLGNSLLHEGDVTSAVFSPDGHRVATVSWDGSARLWEVETGKPLGLPLQHDDKIWSVTFSPDGRRVITASEDRTARIWDVLLDCCQSRRDADRLASLAEIVSGVQVSDTGALGAVESDRKQQMAALASTAKHNAPRLSVDWIIGEFARRFHIAGH